MSSLSAPEMPAVEDRPSVVARGDHPSPPPTKPRTQPARDPISVLIVVPTLDVGAADVGALGLVRILSRAGHRAIVVSQAGRLVADVTAAGANSFALDVASNNPFRMLRSAIALNADRARAQLRCDPCARPLGGLERLISPRGCAAFRFSPAGTRAFATRTSSSILQRRHGARRPRHRGERADRAVDQRPLRHAMGAHRGRAVEHRLRALRSGRGYARARRGDASCLGRQARHQGDPDRRPHRAPQGPSCGGEGGEAAEGNGLKDFFCVFVGEDRGRTHYTGELWDLVLATGTMDVVRMAAPVADMPAAYAAAAVVVSAAVQPEGLQRAILEAQAMARPVVVSDLGAGPDVVLTPPAVPESRITGLRFHAGDDAALAATLLRLFPCRSRPAAHGRTWPRLGARPFQCGARRRADAAALWRDHRPRQRRPPRYRIATKLEVFE